MAIRVALRHVTEYVYDRLVSLGPHEVRLRPAPHCRTPIVSYSLQIEPAQHFINWQQDPHGNFLARLVFPEKVPAFRVAVDLLADMTVINPFDFFVEESAEQFPFSYDPDLARDLVPFLERLPVGPWLDKYLRGIDLSPRKTVNFLVDLNQQLQKDIEYLIRMEPGVQTCETTLEKRSGSCRDSAWLLVQILRNLGLAARFVSGYLIQLTPDIKPLDGPTGPTLDFTDLHAWTEVYLPGAGWIGLDPTSGLLTGEGHIPLAATPVPQTAAPISGSLDETEVEFHCTMSVERAHEDPRVTKPYTPAQWEAIDRLGHAVDERLRRSDVRLTMGGEPTFVSIDDMESAEWNTAAVGPQKQARSVELIRRLLARFAPGGLLHFGQGKWYPGESLPRWAYTCMWRRDGEVIWSNPRLFADVSQPAAAGPEQAQEFLSVLAGRLGVSDRWIREAHEDVWSAIGEEQKLPVDVDPREFDLDDTEDRRRLASIIEQGLSRSVGYVLPLTKAWWQARPQWISGPWPFRSERLFLLPGDSPLGLRLPLDSLPVLGPADRRILYAIDPFDGRPALPGYTELRRSAATALAEARAASITGQQRGRTERATPPDDAVAADVVRTALCIEPRNGQLHIFMPPVATLEDYLELIAAAELTAEELGQQVVFEGYLPPHDHRLQVLKVTPDPGVIEVNVHPAHSWEELREITTGVYEEARKARLGTEKFQLDGRHTGTGGGNHLVVGGATPADSPFVRRPDVLRSLVTYWNNHPALSYLFSGQFIGPTSQAPRVDEGRRDALYELELACATLPENGYTPPWLVDRIFRNLLVDLTGNTHRAEFCIDKLYSPDHANGRLGLVELRGFEMPPHAQMSLIQQLLVRAAVAWFWESPYRAPLVRWGTALHDRCLLPHFLKSDLDDVLRDLRQAGFEFQADWFAPQLEFRCPPIGAIERDGMRLELRQAIEPWYVLGEEAAVGGTTRYVDSSVERMEVLISGFNPERFAVACNGRVVPLQSTGTVGEYFGGVRYRAWQPPSCLHPTIGVNTPLLFDVVDRWQSRSVGGCRYHIDHPGGLNPRVYPINALEAESRRACQFFKFGYTGGELTVMDERPHPEYPCTLDLRQPANIR